MNLAREVSAVSAVSAVGCLSQNQEEPMAKIVHLTAVRD